MIVTKEPMPPQKVFEAVRATVREIHPEAIFEEDPTGAPFLFKSKDAKVWVRVFYRSMSDSTSEELARELLKLKVLTPKDAMICLFYPLLDRQQLLKFHAVGGRLVFFEYGGLLDGQPRQRSIQVRKWIPDVVSLPEPASVRSTFPMKTSTASFLGHMRLSREEIAGLNDLGSSLQRA